MGSTKLGLAETPFVSIGPAVYSLLWLHEYDVSPEGYLKPSKLGGSL